MSEKTDKNSEELAPIGGIEGRPLNDAAPDSEVRRLSDFLPEHTAEPDVVAQPSINAETLLSTKDWEARLVKARAEREKALARKSVKSKSSKPKQALFADFLHQSRGAQFEKSMRKSGAGSATTQSAARDIPQNIVSVATDRPLRAQTQKVSVDHWTSAEPAPVAHHPKTVSPVTAAALGVSVGFALGAALIAGLNGTFQTPVPAAIMVPPQAVLPTASLDAETDMVVSRAVTAQVPITAKTRFPPAPELGSTLPPSPNAAVYARVQFLASDIQLPRAFSAAVKPVSVSPQRPVITTQPTVFIAQTKALPENVVLASLAIDMAALDRGPDASFGTLVLPWSTDINRPGARPLPAALDIINGAKSHSLPVLDAGPQAIRVATRLPSLTTPDEFNTSDAFSYSDAPHSPVQTAILSPAATNFGQDALPFVGPSDDSAAKFDVVQNPSDPRAESVPLVEHTPSSID